MTTAAGSAPPTTLIFNSADGAGIKLMNGSGTPSDAPDGSASGVTVHYNTIYNTDYGIIVGGDGTNDNVVNRNLISTINTAYGPEHIGVKIDNITQSNGASVTYNYGADFANGLMTKLEGTQTGTVTQNNNTSTTTSAGFNNTQCGGFNPSNSTAANYGWLA